MPECDSSNLKRGVAYLAELDQGLSRRAAATAPHNKTTHGRPSFAQASIGCC
jgi:hypothetical protein